MNTELSRLELTGPGGHAASGRPERGRRLLKPGSLLLLAALAVSVGLWMLVSGTGKPAESRSVGLATAVAPQPRLSRAVAASPVAFDPPTAAGEAIVPQEPAPVDGLKISSQSWRRGGLGSNALVTFTLRNRNDYAVRDIELSCAFARRDGSHLTDRIRVIHDVVNTRSRKTFARLHVGFVNVNASKLTCTPLAARHA